MKIKVNQIIRGACVEVMNSMPTNLHPRDIFLSQHWKNPTLHLQPAGEEGVRLGKKIS
jgi:hypothetical protein